MNSNNQNIRKLTIKDINSMKKNNEKIVLTNIYDFNTALMADEAGIDLIGIGGSTSEMILGGEENAYKASIEDVIFMVSKAAKGLKRALLIGSLPFGSYQQSNENAINSAIRIIKAGANSVKIQGATETILQRIKSIVEVGIPCVGHAGLLPEYIYKLGGFRSIGKTADEAIMIFKDVKKLIEVGVWLIEMECVPYKIAEEISKKVDVPIIGIGSGNKTDGQTLAFHDILGLQKTHKLKHAKCYRDLWPLCVEGLKEFKDEVKQLKFPSKDFSFEIPDPEYKKFIGYIK